jgi:hypothetical protein
MAPDENIDDTIPEESKIMISNIHSKIIDTDPIVEEEKEHRTKLKDDNEITYSVILAKTEEDNWDLFDLPQFNEESAD